MRKIFLPLIFIFVMLLPSASFSASVTLKKGTEVLVKNIERIKSNKVKKGQAIQFLVERAVKDNNGFTIIEQGAYAYGTVVKASSAGMFGSKGALELSIDSVEAYDGTIIPLTATLGRGGSSSSGAVIAGAVLISPVAIFFRGSNAVVESGTIFRAYVKDDVVINTKSK